MATFWGDILRLLAHTGFQTAGGIGKELVGSYLKPGMEVREAAGKNLLDIVRTQTGAPAEAAAESLAQDYKVKWPREPVVNPLAPQAGTRYLGPEGSRLTALAGAPQSKLEELATAGYKPETALVRGKATLDELRTRAVEGAPPEEQRGLLFPREPALVEGMLRETGRREDKAAALEERKRASQAIEDLRRDALTQQHDRLLSETDYKKEQIKSRNKMIDIIGGAKRTVEEQKYADKLTKALENVTLYQDDPDKAYSHAQNFNSILAVAAKKFPDTIGDEYTPFRLTPRVEGRIWDTKPTITPGVKEEGGTIGKGPTPPEFPEKVTLPEGGEAIRTEHFSLKTGKPLYKFPDGTLRSY